jgi:carbohydrate diacid regulator
MAVLSSISQKLAEQIVITVKDVCGQDVNFIDPNGIIYASTDAKRVGSYHDIGRMAAKEGRAIEVTKNDNFKGSHPGINVPIYHNHKLLAVIGITGDPKKVRKYALLAEKITNLLIREMEVNEYARTLDEKINFILQSLINEESINSDYLNEVCRDLKINTESPKSILLIKINNRYNPKNLSMIESHLKSLFISLPEIKYMFRYPSEYVCLADTSYLAEKGDKISAFVKEHAPLIRCAIGSSTDLYLIKNSYATAQTALASLEKSGQFFCFFDNLTLEILLSSLSSNNRQMYLSKTLDGLSEADLELLAIYFEEDLSLKQTAKRLFVHVNTLQYRLNRIAEITSFNPRKIKGAVPLYLALLLK